MREKRAAKRYDTNIHTAIYSAVGNKELRDEKATIINISTLGLCFQSRARFKEGELIKAHFQIPTFPSCALKSQILWRQRNPYMSIYGAQLTDNSLADMRVIKKYVEARSGKIVIGGKSKLFLESILAIILFYIFSKFLAALPFQYTVLTFVVVLGALILYLTVLNRR